MSIASKAFIGYIPERDELEQQQVEEKALATARALAARFSKQWEEHREERGELPWQAISALKESGLTNAVIPASRGGLGLRWPAVTKVVREIASGDGSVGAVLGYHLMQVFHLRREETTRWHALDEEIASKRLWLAGVVNPRDDDLTAQRQGQEYRLNGRKNYCTGSGFADLLNLSISIPQESSKGFALVPSDREGIELGHDWDAIGLERSETSSVRLKDVLLKPEEISIEKEDSRGRFTAGVRGLVNQSFFVNFYVGFTQGALRSAKSFIHEYSRAWLRSDADKASEDILIRSQFGELWLAFEGMTALADRAAEKIAILLAAGENFTDAERGEAAAAIAVAKANAIRQGLNICTRIFELMGARATSNRYGLDRFWKDLRTHSLHDPVAYKLIEIGDYALNDRYVEVGAYQ